MEEIWKDIKGYEGLYQVSSFGRVRSSVKSSRKKVGKYKYLSPHYDDKYVRYTLVREGVSKGFMCHRLVAEAFIPNPENKPEVDHINTVGVDNRVENLRWCTRQENMNNDITLQRHRDKLKGDKNPSFGKFSSDSPVARQVLQYNLSGELIREWFCISDITREFGFDGSSITKNCKHKSNTAYGYRWEYK